MKKLITASVFLIVPLCFLAQPITYVEAPLYDNSTTAGRAPNGTSAHGYMRACALVLQSELTNIAAGTNITSFGFTLNSGTGTTPCPGTFSLYLQNTTDIAYLKGTTFATCLLGMTQVYASAMTIPASATTTSVTITLSSAFLYTGGGLYVAYDWFSGGPFDATAAIYRANSLGLVPGCATANSNVSAPTTLATTAFRPCFLWGIANTFTNDVQFIGMTAPGRVTSQFNTPHSVTALIKNASNGPLTNIPVTLNVGGANVFSNTQTITSLASGSVTTVTFAPFNPLLSGLNTLSVTVPSDQNNQNNLGTYSQSVICNEWAANPAIGTYTNTSVGFGTGSGIIAVSYSNPVTSTVTGLRCSISTNTPSIGNNTWGVVLSAAGLILGTTNTITINNGMLGTFQNLTLTTPVPLTAGTSYYFGFAQPANTTAYYPAGTMSLSYVPTIYATTALTGGAMTPLATNLGYFGLEAIFAPNITITAPSVSVVCGNNAVLTASSSANTYSWNTGALTPSISVSNSVTTIFTVTSSNTLGCVASRTLALNILPIPLNGNASSTVVCAGQPITFSASGATTYTWNNGTSTSNGANYSDTPGLSITYTLSGANPNGCTATNLIPILVNPLPIMSAAVSSSSICIGSTVSVSASGANTYTWDNGAQTASIIDTPTATMVYTVTGTSTLNCNNTATVSVVVNTFTPGITTSTTLCSGDAITLNATGGAALSYTWSNGANLFPSITVTPNVTSTYSVAAVSAINGCLGSAAVTITVNPKPNLMASADRTVMCRNESNTLTAQGATSYSWGTGATTSVIVINPTTSATTPSLFVVNGSFTTGCSVTLTVSVKVNACTGLEEFNQGGVSAVLMPNPGHDQLNILFSQVEESMTIRILSAGGQLVQEIKTSSPEVQVDLREAAAGLYFVNIASTSQGSRTYKWIKQ